MIYIVSESLKIKTKVERNATPQRIHNTNKMIQTWLYTLVLKSKAEFLATATKKKCVSGKIASREKRYKKIVKLAYMET